MEPVEIKAEQKDKNINCVKGLWFGLKLTLTQFMFN